MICRETLIEQDLQDSCIAETLLLALLRGSGPAGLAAMPPVPPWGAVGW